MPYQGPRITPLPADDEPEWVRDLVRAVRGSQQKPHVVYADAPGDDPLEARKFEFWEVARGFGVTWEQFELDWAEYVARKKREAGGE